MKEETSRKENQDDGGSKKIRSYRGGVKVKRINYFVGAVQQTHTHSWDLYPVN